MYVECYYVIYRITDSYESFVLKILSLLMVDGPASYFHKALLEANLGSDFSPSTGLVFCAHYEYLIHILLCVHLLEHLHIIVRTGQPIIQCLQPK